MTRRIIILLALCTFIAASVSAQSNVYKREIGDFREFTVADHINVEYKYSTDSAGYVSFECSPRLASALTFSLKNEKLKIEVISDNPLIEPLPTVHIYSSTLDKATNLGDSTVCLLEVKPVEKLSLKVMGNGLLKAININANKLSATSEAGSGHIYAQGKCKEANYTILGAGVIECGEMDAESVKVKMAGTGSIDCTAQKQLTVYGLGSGSVYYAGKPEIKKRNLGVKLIPINQ